MYKNRFTTSQIILFQIFAWRYISYSWIFVSIRYFRYFIASGRTLQNFVYTLNPNFGLQNIYHMHWCREIFIYFSNLQYVQHSISKFCAYNGHIWYIISTINTAGAEFPKICNDPQFQQNCNNFINSGANCMKFSPKNVKTCIWSMV